MNLSPSQASQLLWEAILERATEAEDENGMIPEEVKKELQAMADLAKDPEKLNAFLASLKQDPKGGP